MFQMFRKKFDLAVHYKAAFSTEAGRIVLADLVSHAGILNSSFDENARQHAFNEGQKEPIRRILQFLNVDFKEAERLLEENNNYNKKYSKES